MTGGSQRCANLDPFATAESRGRSSVRPSTAFSRAASWQPDDRFGQHDPDGLELLSPAFDRTGEPGAMLSMLEGAILSAPDG